MKTPLLPAGSTVEYKGKTIVINGLHYDCRVDDNLNELQKAHIRGDINLYRPIECYEEQWYHGLDHNKDTTYYPIEGTKVREDLPPIYIQWKDAYRKANDIKLKSK